MCHCLSIFTIITQTKTGYNSWMFQTHFIWVLSTSVHSAKWSSARHRQNVSQSTKLEENHVNGKPKTHLQWFIQIQSNGTSKNLHSSLKNGRNMILFKSPWWQMTLNQNDSQHLISKSSSNNIYLGHIFVNYTNSNLPHLEFSSFF